jgi:hypothetical protein
MQAILTLVVQAGRTPLYDKMQALHASLDTPSRAKASR